MCSTCARGKEWTMGQQLRISACWLALAVYRLLWCTGGGGGSDNDGYGDGDDDDDYHSC